MAMTSGRRTVRVPVPSDLYDEPPLGPLLLLEFAVAVAANALRARHIAIEGDFHPSETAEVSAARVLAHACDQLAELLGDYRRGIFARLHRERSAWPF
jgi:hypothetical protein